MRTIWSRIDARLEAFLIVAFYAYFCLIILVEVARRYLFSAASEWGEMTARYAFVYLVYLAIAHVAKTRDDIRIDIVPRKLGPTRRLVLYLYFDFLYLVLVVFVIYYSIQVIGLSVENHTVMTGFDLNVAFAQAALPIGWGLLAYRIVQRVVRTVGTYRDSGEVALGGGGFGD